MSNRVGVSLLTVWRTAAHGYPMEEWLSANGKRYAALKDASEWVAGL